MALPSRTDPRYHLESQIRECYGRCAYTHKIHEKMAERLATRQQRGKWFNIILSALITGGAVSVIFSKESGLAIYAGYATTALNPEPYAYEGAFSVRWVIDAQIKGDARLNYDSQRGEVTSPVVLWGPYLWGDGVTPRKADGMVWKRDDFAGDGTHPNDSGRRKVADLLLGFFHADPYARGWYLKDAAAAPKE